MAAKIPGLAEARPATRDETGEEVAPPVAGQAGTRREHDHPLQDGRQRLPPARHAGLKAGLLVLAGALLLLVPALLAGRPFEYWDTPTFYGWGHDIIAAIRSPWPPLAHFPAHRGLWAADNYRGAWDRITPREFQLFFTSIGARSKFYAVPFYLLGSTLTLWAPAACQALIAAGLLWVATAMVLPDARAPTYLRLMVVLTVATTAPFMVAFLMPDVFAAFGLLSLALLLCFPDRLTRGQAIGCAVLFGACVLVHLSILPTVIGLLLLGSVMVRLLAPAVPLRRGASAAAAALLGAAVVAVVSGAGMRAIFGEPVRSPPFVEGRVIVDGPGQQFLREACARRHFAACLYKDRKVWSPDDIIWPDVSRHDLPRITDPAERHRFLDEQPAVVFDTLLDHPLAQLIASARNAAKQLLDFTIAQDVGGSLPGLLDARTDRTMRTVEIMPDIGPCLGGRSHACDDTHMLRRLQPLQYAVVAAAAAVLGLCVLLWLRHGKSGEVAEEDRRLAAFALAIAAGVVLNAVVCGALSGPWGRYQARVVWLVPMVAVLLLERLWLRSARPAPRWRRIAAMVAPRRAGRAS